MGKGNKGNKGGDKGSSGNSGAGRPVNTPAPTENPPAGGKGGKMGSK